MPLLLDLPWEVLYQIFLLVPDELYMTCVRFYEMQNRRYRDIMVREFGPAVLERLANQDREPLANFILSMDYWRRPQRQLLELKQQLTEEEKYIADSWRWVYSTYKSRRLYLESEDVKVDEGSYVSDGLLHVNNTYLLSYRKKVRLSPGIYGLECAVIFENPHAFADVSFAVYEGGLILSKRFPASNLPELFPKDRVVHLTLGGFVVALNKAEPGMEDHCLDIDIVMESAGPLLKSGFTICYLDVVPMTARELNENAWIGWHWENEVASPSNEVNVLLKRVYDGASPYKASELPNPDRMAARQLQQYSQRYYRCQNEAGEQLQRRVKYYTVLQKRMLEPKKHGAYKPDMPAFWKLPRLM